MVLWWGAIFVAILMCKSTAPVVQKLSQRWLGAISVGEGCVLITPLESNELHCLNLLDGKPSGIRPRGDNLYVAGIHHGKTILVGKRQGKCGQSGGWQSRAAGAAAPSGENAADGGNTESPPRPCPAAVDFEQRQLFLPLSSGEVIRVDLNTGKIADRAKSRDGSIPSNLICHQRK